MKRLKPMIAILLMLCMVMLPACGGGKTDGGEQTGESGDKNRTINVALTTLVDSFYTPNEYGITEGYSLAQVYDTLIVQNEDGTYGPGLAEDWEVSPDGLTYTFHLREDVKWHDGEPFTAEDVKYTFDKYMEAPLFAFFYPVRVEENIVVDEHTFAVKLKTPMASFICNMFNPCMSSIMSKHACEEYGDEYGTSPETTVGTGPYTVSEWEPGVSITFKANPDYFKGEPSIESVCFHQMADINSIAVAMQTGDLDLSFSSMSGGNYDTLKAEPDIVMEEYPDTTYHSIYMYCKSGLFSDVRVRQAVAYAINKEDVLTVALDGRGEIMDYLGDLGTLINGNPDIVPEHTYEYDLEKAKELIKEAGVEGESVVITSYNTEPYVSIDTYLQSVLTSIGLNATVQPVERATFIDDIGKENFSIGPVGKADPGMDMESTFFSSVGQNYLGTGGNYGYYYNEEVEELGLQADQESDPEKRKELYAQIINIISEDVPCIPLYALEQAIPHSADIETTNYRGQSMFNYQWVE